MENARRAAFSFFSKALGRLRSSCALRYKKVRGACGILKSWDVFISMRRGRAWKKRARRTATASLPLWARIPRVYIWNNELERAKDAICERPLNLYVCRRGALWLAYHRTQTQSATQWEFLFNPSTDIDSYYSYDTRTRQKCFIRTGYSFQPSIRLNSIKLLKITFNSKIEV